MIFCFCISASGADVSSSSSSGALPPTCDRQAPLRFHRLPTSAWGLCVPQLWWTALHWPRRWDSYPQRMITIAQGIPARPYRQRRQLRAVHVAGVRRRAGSPAQSVTARTWHPVPGTRQLLPLVDSAARAGQPACGWLCLTRAVRTIHVVRTATYSPLWS
jgi:hypothetical protein